MIPHVPSSGALLDPLAGLDPLSTLDTPMDTTLDTTLDDCALEPLDHSLLMDHTAHGGMQRGGQGGVLGGGQGGGEESDDGLAASGAGGGGAGSINGRPSGE